MSFTVSSPKATCIVDTGNLTFVYSKAVGGGQGVYGYLGYTKGAEAGITIAIAYLNKEFDSANYFQAVKADSSYVLTPLIYTITASGNYLIPIVVPLGVTSVKVTFDGVSGTENGTITFDIDEGE